MQLVRLVKILHTLTAMGMGGGLAVVALLILRVKPTDPGFMEIRHAIDAIFEWVLVPSMAICVFSGFASMIVHGPYWNALWAWAKGLLGLPTLIMTIRLQSVAHRLIDPEYVSGPVEMAEQQDTEWKLVWSLLIISAAQVIIGIWRPRFKTEHTPARARSNPAPSTPASSESAAG